MMGKDRRNEGGMDEGREEKRGGGGGVGGRKKITGCLRRINLGLGELSYHYRLRPRCLSPFVLQ